MNTAKVYKDIDNNDCTIHQMVRSEPGWAASRIQAGEEALAMVQRIRNWDMSQYQEHGKFALPESIRRAISELST